MKIRNSLFLIAALVAGLYMTGCTEEDGVNGGDAPAAVEVTSMANNTFGVRWTRGSGDAGVNKIIATPFGGGTETVVTTSSTVSSGTITVPAAGKYNIQVESSTGNRSVAVTWATAVRFGQPVAIRLYETAAPITVGASGLILSNGTAVSTEGVQQGLIDLVLATDNALPGVPYLSLQGADVAGSGIPGGVARQTRLGNQYFVVTAGLDGDFYSASFAGEFNNNVNYIPIPGTVSAPIIVLVKTADNPPHYARVEIVPQANGLLWGDTPGSPSYRYIDVKVSYQTIAGEAYAGRPIGVARGFNTAKVGGAKAVVKN